MSLSPEDARDLRRWAICGAIIVIAHGGVASVLANWDEGVPPGEPPSAITLELAPVAAAPSQEQTDRPIAPPQEQSEAQPEDKPVVAKEPEKPREEPPPPDKAEVVLPQPEPPKPEVKPQPKKKVAVATAPEAARQVAPRAVAPAPGMGEKASQAMPNWKGLISAMLQRAKSYPAAARARREEGTATLTFTLNRQGQVVSASISQSSGFAELDQESLAVVRRAGPFPAPPADIPGQRFPFSVPLRYYLR